jgi:hypothetical protein
VSGSRSRILASLDNIRARLVRRLHAEDLMLVVDYKQRALERPGGLSVRPTKDSFLRKFPCYLQLLTLGERLAKT